MHPFRLLSLFVLVLPFPFLSGGCQTAETETISRCIPAGSCGDDIALPKSPAKKPVFNADSGDAGKGKQLYEQLCANCHGSDGKGVATMMMVQDLGSGVWQQTRTDAEIRMILTQGKGQMPAFPNLNSKDTRDVIRYVRTLRRVPKSPTGSGY